MTRLQFRPRATFKADLKQLGRLDPTIIDDVRVAIDELLENGTLSDEYGDHPLKRRLSGYRELHVRDTPRKKQPNDINDVLVIWYVERNELIAVGVRVGAHDRLFSNQNSLKKYHK
ncbi:type II toxin-antitoxin system YafQ family toxin [Lactobacillus bombicola]|uniref:Type II toxin-antitoxin system YafQ family toxin n=1 Tax=Lactobacillus bombicola TaxID=1505723 RepID=A0A396SS54_9LACO|nr:type II toxin-antitoxin system YafQ family toxin [Lactobacillus bombicola]RHW54274.1 type II toxin-antitoxin system YafQ family toxin [Lactobacillus bombicola]